MHLLLDSENSEEQWPITQQSVNFPVTHWSTLYTFAGIEIKTRKGSIDNGFKSYKILSFDKNKSDILKVLLFIIYDTWMVYLDNIKKMVFFNKTIIPQVNTIYIFIQKRVQQIYDYIYDEDTIKYIVYESLNKSPIKNINIEYIFSQSNIKRVVNNIMKGKSSKFKQILYNSMFSTNYKLILKILDTENVSSPSTYETLINRFESMYDINIRDTNGFTSLCVACIHNFSHIVIQLINKGSNINLSDNQGVTCLMYACSNNYNTIVNILIHYGALIDITDENGYAALHYACRHNNKKPVEILIKHNVNVNIKDNKGYTALDYVTYEGYTEIYELLTKTQTDSTTDLVGPPVIITIPPVPP